MKRIFGMVLLGLGLALAVFAAGLRFSVAPTGANIPYDLEPSISIAEAANGSYIDADLSSPTVGQQIEARLRSTTWVVPQPVLTRDKLAGTDLEGTAVIWDVYSQMIDIRMGTILTGGMEEIALDRKSGAAVDWDGTFTDSGDGREPASFEGHSYKLPFFVEQKSYPFWDDTIGAAFDLDYVATEEVSGLTAYRFEHSLPAQVVDYGDENRALLRDAFGGGSGEIYYSVQRTLWIEPVTGQFLNVKQSVKLEFRGGNGATVNLLSGDFEYTDETKASSLESISGNRDLLLLVTQTLPLYAGGAGVLLLVVGIVLIAVGGTKPKAPAEPVVAAAAPAATPAAPPAESSESTPSA